MGSVRVYVRYYCGTCNAPVAPYSRFEQETLAPEQAILLRSFNAKVDPEDRVGWCFSCTSPNHPDGRWRPLVRRTEVEIRQMFIRRRGVEFRDPRDAKLARERFAKGQHPRRRRVA